MPEWRYGRPTEASNGGGSRPFQCEQISRGDPMHHACLSTRPSNTTPLLFSDERLSIDRFVSSRAASTPLGWSPIFPTRTPASSRLFSFGREGERELTIEERSYSGSIVGKIGGGREGCPPFDWAQVSEDNDDPSVTNGRGQQLHEFGEREGKRRERYRYIYNRFGVAGCPLIAVRHQ